MKSQVELFSWAGVVAFYVAHQLAHAVFACSDFLPPQFKNPQNHASQDFHSPGTNYVIKRHFRSIEPAYLDLYSTSRAVRYEGQSLDDRGLDYMVQTLGEVARWARKELVENCRIDVPDWVVELANTPSAEPEVGRTRNWRDVQT